MEYKVILVHQKSDCCNTTPIAGEIEQTANRMASQGYVLVTAYQQAAAVQSCGSAGAATGAILVFARER
jgi:hypothetical protein